MKDLESQTNIWKAIRKKAKEYKEDGTLNQKIYFDYVRLLGLYIYQLELVATQTDDAKLSANNEIPIIFKDIVDLTWDNSSQYPVLVSLTNALIKIKLDI